MHTKLTLLLLCAVPTASATAQMAVGPFFGDNAQAKLGTVVERIGDVDGDGKPDFAIGAPFSDEVVNFGIPIFVADAGAVSVYSGADGQLIWKAVGPIVGDTEFGAAIANAGDVDLDGHDDVLVGLPTSNGYAVGSGSVKLLSGADGSTMDTYFGSQTGERYGASICAGHLDPDGSSVEAGIGAPYHDLHGVSAGPGQEGRVEVVEVWTGTVKADLVGYSFSVPGAVFLDDIIRRSFGHRVQFVDDADGNGYGSLLVSSPLTDYIEYGPSGSTTRSLAGLVQVFEPLNPASTILSGSRFVGESSGDLLGLQLKALSDDMNGDGTTDWVSWAPGSGRLRLFYGEVSAMSVTNSLLAGMTSVDSVGDANLDGFPDLAVGVPGLGGSYGNVYYVSGDSGSVYEAFEGTNPGGQFGAAVAGFDMDGDGETELWIGAPTDDTMHPNGGAVFVRSKGPCFDAADWFNFGPGLAGTFGVPTLSLISNPVQGYYASVTLGSVTPWETQALLLIGDTTASIPIFGGILSVLPFEVEWITLPTGSSTVSLWIPEGPSYCGAKFFLQAIQRNPDTPGGWAFSQAVALTLGS